MLSAIQLYSTAILHADGLQYQQYVDTEYMYNKKGFWNSPVL